MNQAQSDLNADSAAGRRNPRRAYVLGVARTTYLLGVGLMAVAIAAVVIEKRNGYVPAGSDLVNSSLVPLVAIPNTMTDSDSAKPRFERSNEPANDDDSEKPHGG